jgi:hypothetical protein
MLLGEVLDRDKGLAAAAKKAGGRRRDCASEGSRALKEILEPKKQRLAD